MENQEKPKRKTHTSNEGANKLQIFLPKTKKKFENRVILELFWWTI